MGDYITRAEALIAVGSNERLVELTDRNGDGLEDDGILDDAIARAESMVNSYVRKKREVPVTPAPQVLKDVAAKMTDFILKEDIGATTEKDERKHDRCIEWLEKVAAGSVVLGVNPAPAASPLNSSRSWSRPTSKAVSREKMKGYS